MDLNPNETQEMIRDGARRMLAEVIDPDAVRAIEATPDGLATEVWDQMTSLGWTGIALPERIGGGGGGLVDLCMLAEELGASAASTPLVATSGFAAPLLASLAPSAAIDDVLAKLATTNAIIVGALVDADGRNERSTPTCRLTEADDDFIVSGTKVLVPFASVAETLLVATGTEAGELAIAAIGADAKGVSVSRHTTTGASPTFEVTFDQVSVPSDRILARGAAAENALDAALDAATVLATAEAVGQCESMIRISAEYATNRVQFGQPIGKFQAVSHRIADMRINTDALRLLALESAWLLDEGREATLEVAGTKVFANEVVVEMIHTAHAVHGAIGYTNEYDLQLFTRRARAYCLNHGDTDQQSERAAVALGL